VRERRVGDEDLALGCAERYRDAREVHDRVGSERVEELARRVLVGEVEHALVDPVESGRRTIDADDRVPGCREPGAQAPTESTRRAGDDDEHASSMGV
jgi:hypothetical protein